jgi:hypothetical protein
METITKASSCGAGGENSLIRRPARAANDQEPLMEE